VVRGGRWPYFLGGTGERRGPHLGYRADAVRWPHPWPRPQVQPRRRPPRRARPVRRVRRARRRRPCVWVGPRSLAPGPRRRRVLPPAGGQPRDGGAPPRALKGGVSVQCTLA
jgi:hypothetical protein